MLMNENYIDSFIKTPADHHENSQFSEVIEEDKEDSDSDDVQIIEQETVIVDLDDYEETEMATNAVQEIELKSLAVENLETKNDAEDSCLQIDVPSELQKEFETPLKTQENEGVRKTVAPEDSPEPKTHQEQPKIYLADPESCSEFQQVYPEFPAVSQIAQQNAVAEELKDPVATGNSEEIKLEQPMDPISVPTVASVAENTVASNAELKNVDDFSPLNIGNVVSLFQTFRGEDDDSLEGIELFDFDSV